MAQTERGDQLHRFRVPDPADGRKLLDRASAQVAERFVFYQQFAGDFDRIRAAHARPQQDRDQLWISQRRRATSHQFFPRPFLLRHFADFQLRH